MGIFCSFYFRSRGTNGRVHRSLETTLKRISRLRTILAQKIPTKIVFCFWSAFYNAEQNKGNVSSIQASKRNIPAKNTPAKIHSVPRWTIKKKTIFTASDRPCDFSRAFYFVTWQKAILVWWKKLHKNTVQRVSPQVWLPWPRSTLKQSDLYIMVNNISYLQ